MRGRAVVIAFVTLVMLLAPGPVRAELKLATLGVKGMVCQS